MHDEVKPGRRWNRQGYKVLNLDRAIRPDVVNNIKEQWEEKEKNCYKDIYDKCDGVPQDNLTILDNLLDIYIANPVYLLVLFEKLIGSRCTIYTLPNTLKDIADKMPKNKTRAQVLLKKMEGIDILSDLIKHRPYYQRAGLGKPPKDNTNSKSDPKTNLITYNSNLVDAYDKDDES